MRAAMSSRRFHSLAYIQFTISKYNFSVVFLFFLRHYFYWTERGKWNVWLLSRFEFQILRGKVDSRARRECLLCVGWTVTGWMASNPILVYSQPLKNKYGKVRWSKACGTFQRNCYLTSVSNGFWRNRVTAFPLIRRHLNAMLVLFLKLLPSLSR